MHITKHRSTVEDISDTASKEFSNSSNMSKMKEDWKELEFTTTEMEGKNSPILSGEAVEIFHNFPNILVGRLAALRAPVAVVLPHLLHQNAVAESDLVG